MSEIILNVKGLSAGYGGKKAVNNAELTINRKTFVSIIGPNGSGKTTLLKAITGVIKPIAGEVLFGGLPFNSLSGAALAKKIAFVAQIHDSAIFDMTVWQYVSLGRIPHFSSMQWMLNKADRESVTESLDSADILDLKDRNMSSLSGGERQRAFIARALAQEPSLLIMDEPTLNLDIAHAIQVCKIVKRKIISRDMTVLVVLHDINLASANSDKIVMMKDGAIAFSGEPEKVITALNIDKVFGAHLTVVSGGTHPVPQVLY